MFEQKFPHGVYKWSSDNDDSKVNSKGTNRSTTGFTASLLSNDCSLSKQPAPNTTQNLRTKFFLTNCNHSLFVLQCSTAQMKHIANITSNLRCVSKTAHLLNNSCDSPTCYSSTTNDCLAL